MRRLLPQPAVSVALFVVWLLADDGFTLGGAAVGAVLAIAIPLWTAKFWPGYPRRVRLLPLLRLAVVVAFDIVVANLRVAVLVLGPLRRVRPTFIEVPLALESDHALTLLASLMSLTPGTVLVNVSGDRRTLLVHGLAIGDGAREIARIKSRYEALVKEAFE
ncbi:MAG: Na+/H+ antiporter subunit E [Labilithrix sp.]|nr:Na+/H+ antiporter subunit E [Labilithrix sp.]